MFRSIVMSACLAGFCAGSVLTLIQQPTVAPLILAAEVYESRAAPSPIPLPMASPALSPAESPVAGTASRTHQHADLAHDGDGHGHSYGNSDTGWAPANGIERTFWSLIINVSSAIGFALLLCAVYTLLPSVTAARGLLWGLAGFVVFFANPGLGLHPEIPGTLSANLFDRQLWWLFTALVSALAVALIAWRRVTWTWVAALALLALPHVIGAPQPQAPTALAPQALTQQFIWATVFVNAVFWLTLGAISALVFRRFASLPASA